MHDCDFFTGRLSLTESCGELPGCDIDIDNICTHVCLDQWMLGDFKTYCYYKYSKNGYI